MANRIANVIPHMKSYVLGKRTISIHSYDRDKNKFKEANEFEIKLPETFTNIQAIRLVNLDMPGNLFSFSTKIDSGIKNLGVKYTSKKILSKNKN